MFYDKPLIYVRCSVDLCLFYELYDPQVGVDMSSVPLSTTQSQVQHPALH